MKKALTFIFQTLLIVTFVSGGVWALVDFYSFALFIGKIVVSIMIIGGTVLLFLFMIAQILDIKR